MVMPKNGFWLAAALDLVDMMVETYAPITM
jgi:hypothetical protein